MLHSRALMLLLAFTLLIATANSKRSARLRHVFDAGVNSFSKEGRILQADFAAEAGKRGGSLVAVQSKSAVLLAIPCEIQQHILQDSPPSSKLLRLDDQSFLAFSGLAGDGIAAARQLRSFSSAFQSEFGYSPSPSGIATALADSQLESNVRGGELPLL